MFHLGLSSLPAVALSCALAGPSWAASSTHKVPELPGEQVEFQTRDGWTISGRWLPAKDKALTFILLHDAAGRHQDWYYLAKAMARQGLGYLAVDLRGHNLSQKPPEGQPAQWRDFPKPTKDYNEWDNMREDVSAAVRFLTGKGVSEVDIALGGSDVGGSVALKYAAVHPEVSMVFLLSPGLRYHEVLTVNAIRAYKGRPILLVVGDDDVHSVTESSILYQFAKRSAGSENVMLLHVKRRHGARMLAANRGLSDRILAWIDNPIQFQTVELSTDTLLKEFASENPAPATQSEGDLPSEGEMDQSFGQQDGE